MTEASDKGKILEACKAYVRSHHANFRLSSDKPFIPGETEIPYAGRIFDHEEVVAGVSSVLDFWLTLGEHGKAFQQKLASYLGTQLSVLVNSGSSANLVALASLTSHKIPEEKRLKQGDEVITCAAGFPTTVVPCVQLGLVPVFLDNSPLTGNLSFERIEEAYVPGKTKALMIAHTLGNPFDLGKAMEFCKKNNLWLIEDNCDALGSLYTVPVGHSLRSILDRKMDNPNEPLTRKTGSWGDLSTQSFYPAHHITMGEGGSVNIVHERRLRLYVESFRDWGRDCWCDSGKENTCNKRFSWKLGDLPEGYDHKYIYSHLGYNFKPTDMQAAIGVKQLDKVDAFGAVRRSNWLYLRKGLHELSDYFEFMLPTHAQEWNDEGFVWDDSGFCSDPSWFGFMLRVRPEAPFSRKAFVDCIQSAKIGNRMLFGGNITRQPAFVNLKRVNPNAFRVVGNLDGADRLMNEAVFIGVYPGITTVMLDYMIEIIRDFVKGVS